MISKILTPTDGSDTAKAAVQYASDIAKAENAEVLVVGVVHSLEYGDTADIDPTSQIEADEKRFVDEEVAALQAAGVKATGTVVGNGRVDRAITQAAKDQGADVIVMGTHGRSGLSRAVIGSVADRVIRHSEVPVVLVPLK